MLTGGGCKEQHPNGTRTCPCGKSLEHALKVVDLGALLGSYRVISIVGHGAFGVAYLAKKDGEHDRYVVLKETLKASNIHGFQVEFSVIQQLNHDHIPCYYDIFEYLDKCYLVMEYISGISLGNLLQSNESALSEKDIVSYAVQLCNVLEYMHNQYPSIVHGDIKPSNVILTPQNRIYLIDFSMMKKVYSNFVYDVADSKKYILKKLINDCCIDIYDLGATVFQLLTRLEPVHKSIRMNARRDPLLPPSEYNSSVSCAMDFVVMKAMSIQKNNKYGSVNLLKQDLMCLF